jgi:glycosyltransferase involved in cell wall biosynthesis
MAHSVSLILLAYRQQDYVEQAIASVLTQTWPRMEIILSDDCSPDGTLQVMQRHADAYTGPHRLVVNQTAGNRGIVGHFNEAVALASGDIVIYLAGDDIATPDRVATLVQALEAHPELAFIESRYVAFTDETRPEPILERLAKEADARGDTPPKLTIFDMAAYRAGHSPWLSSSTRAFRRDLFLRFPPLDPGLASEDSSSALRLLYQGKAAQIEAPLLLKRAHQSNLTGPEALRKLDFDRIGRQYIADAGHAEALGLMTHDERLAFEVWALDRIDRRKLRVLFDLDYPTPSCLFTQILPARSLRPREKFYAIRRCVSGLFRRSR